MPQRFLPVCSLLLLLSAVPAFADPAIGLTGANTLITFDTATPGTIASTVPISGLNAGETIVGADYRPANGQLFALGSAGRLYTINPATGAASFVAPLSVALTGTAFGFDFNPAVDRIRIVSDADQNLRAVPTTGAVTVDGNLAFATGDVNAAANPNVTASAYLNSFGGTATTTLYGIDTNLNILVTQNPPNSGTLNTVGALGVDPSAVTGFDILSTTLGGNTAYAALQVGGVTNIYTVNLATGSVGLLGTVGGGNVLVAFAVAPATSAIPTMSLTMMLLMAAALVAVGAWFIRS